MRESGAVASAQSLYEGRVDIIGVASRGELEEMERFIDDTGVGAFTHLADFDGAIWAAFDVATQPAFAFIDNDGTFTIRTGALDENGLTEAIETLLES